MGSIQAGPPHPHLDGSRFTFTPLPLLLLLRAQQVFEYTSHYIDPNRIKDEKHIHHNICIRRTCARVQADRATLTHNSQSEARSRRPVGRGAQAIRIIQPFAFSFPLACRESSTAKAVCSTVVSVCVCSKAHRRTSRTTRAPNFRFIFFANKLKRRSRTIPVFRTAETVTGTCTAYARYYNMRRAGTPVQHSRHIGNTFSAGKTR